MVHASHVGAHKPAGPWRDTTIPIRIVHLSAAAVGNILQSGGGGQWVVPSRQGRRRQPQPVIAKRAASTPLFVHRRISAFSDFADPLIV
jgi:hypothetical protein